MVSTLDSSSGGSGIISINGDVTAAQTLTVGIAGTDFKIVDDGVGGHVFDLPDAGATARGVVNDTTQTFAGQKTFNNEILTADSGGGIIEGNYSGALSNFGMSQIESVNIFTNGVTGDIASWTLRPDDQGLGVPGGDQGFIITSNGGLPRYQITFSSATYYGQTGTDPAGNAVTGGIITTLGANGQSATLTLAKVTTLGTNGSITFVNGVITGYVAPT